MVGTRLGSRLGAFASSAVGSGADDGSGTPTGGSTTLTALIDDSADPVITAVNFNYLVQVTNTGGTAATSVDCTITLDAGVTFVSASGTGWSFNTAGLPVIHATRATLIGGAPLITITVTSGASAGSYSSSTSALASNAPTTATDTEPTAVNSVSLDAAALRRAPASATEWTNFRNFFSLGGGNPVNLYLAQEASGNLADSIGSNTLTANATPLYQQAVTGWTRKAFQFNETAAQRALSVGGPDPSLTSVAWLVYANVLSLPGGTRDIICFATGASPLKLQTLNATGAKLRLLCLAAGTNGTADPTATGIQPMLVVYDRTNAVLTCYTGQEKFAGTYSPVVVAASSGFGAGTGNSPPEQMVYGAAWSGSSAEFTDTSARNMFNALGFTVPW